MSTVLGMTGPTGSGKSSAADIARKRGIRVIDCDTVARQAVEKGTAGLEALVKAFGNEILDNGGSLNRKTLANAAFSSKKNTELLNRTLLPYISKLVKEQMGGGDVVLDAPTLFESGLDSVCTATLAVLADDSVREKRIIKRDGLTINEAKTRMSAGKSSSYYIEKADHTVYNNGGSDEFSREISKLFDKIFGGNGNV